MIKIAAIHPDVIAEERLRLGEPRLNAEWVELINAGATPVNVAQYFIVNGRGEGVVIALPRRKGLVIGPYQSLLIFSGYPDNAQDPAICYLANQALRVFLKRTGYFWNPNSDKAYLYASKDSYLTNPAAYIDFYQYARRSAKVIVTGKMPAGNPSDLK